MDAYKWRVEELKARLSSNMLEFKMNASAHNYNVLENTMLLYQHHTKNITPAEYNAAVDKISEG